MGVGSRPQVLGPRLDEELQRYRGGTRDAEILPVSGHTIDDLPTNRRYPDFRAGLPRRLWYQSASARQRVLTP